MTAKTEKVLVTTDFSENAVAGLRMAASMANAYGAKLYLLHVISEEETKKMASDVVPPVPLDILAARRRERLIRHFDEAVPEEDRVASKVNPMIRFGEPWEQIIAVGEEIKADVIVMATHGRTGWDHVIHGSVAEKVVRRCTRPVLTIRPQEKLQEKLAFAKVS